MIFENGIKLWMGLSQKRNQLWHTWIWSVTQTLRRYLRLRFLVFCQNMSRATVKTSDSVLLSIPVSHWCPTKQVEMAACQIESWQSWGERISPVLFKPVAWLLESRVRYFGLISVFYCGSKINHDLKIIFCQNNCKYCYTSAWSWFLLADR